MNPWRLARRIRALGRFAEPAPELDGTTQTSATEDDATEKDPAAQRVQATGRELGGSVQVRHIDSGSCNGCEIELAAAFGPVYDADRYGVRLVASPRHADVLAVTGVVTHNMAEPLRRTVEATPRPRLVVAIGDCARNCGEFRGGYGVAGSVADVVEVDAEVPGCPPEAPEIVAALRAVTRR